MSLPASLLNGACTRRRCCHALDEAMWVLLASALHGERFESAARVGVGGSAVAP